MMQIPSCIIITYVIPSSIFMVFCMLPSSSGVHIFMIFDVHVKYWIGLNNGRAFISTL